MLEFTVTVSGGQVAGQLANDPEEMRYFLTELIADAPDDFFEDMRAELEGSGDAEGVAEFLRLFADKLDGTDNG